MMRGALLAFLALIGLLIVSPAVHAQAGRPCALNRVEPRLAVLAEGAQTLCELAAAQRGDRIPTPAEVAGLRRRVQALTTRLDVAQGLDSLERRLASEMTAYLWVLQAAVSEKAARLDDLLASSNALSLSEVDSDLAQAVGVSSRYGRGRNSILLAYLATNAALGFHAERNFSGCVRWAAEADARYYEMLNVFGGAAAGLDSRSRLDGVAEYTSGLLSICAVEAGIDLRPVFAAVAQGRARALAERLQLDAMSGRDRATLVAARSRLRENYTALLNVAQSVSDVRAADARARAIDADEQRIAAALKSREIDGADIERALARSGAAAAVIVTSSDSGGALMGVRIRPGGQSYAGRIAPLLAQGALETIYGRPIGSGASAISRSPRDRRIVEAAAAQKGIRWLRDDLVRRAPGEPDFERALVSLQDEMWRALGAPLVAILADLGVAQGEKVLVLPSGAVTPLPLWLARDPATGQVLIDRYEIKMVPSLQALVEAARRPAQTGVGVVDGVFNPNGDLPGADAERALLESVLGQTLRPFSLAAASTSPARSTWHFATHANANLDHSELSFIEIGLRSAADGRLSAATVQQLSPASKPRLVFMAACETGLSQIGDKPDEFIGLPLAFLSAGADGVVASLWEVSDAPAAFISMKFYEYWNRGASPSAALRAAQLWVRDAHMADLDAALARMPAGDQRIAGLKMQLAAFRGVDPPFANPSFWGAYYYAGL